MWFDAILPLLQLLGRYGHEGRGHAASSWVNAVLQDVSAGSQASLLHVGPI